MEKPVKINNIFENSINDSKKISIIIRKEDNKTKISKEKKK